MAGSQILPNPTIPAKEIGKYRRLKLGNGVDVLLASIPKYSNNPEWIKTFPLVSESFSNYRRDPDDQFGMGCFNDSFLTPKLGRVIGRIGSSELALSPPCKSNFAVAIHSGAFSDPWEFQGMAHFVEHLVHHGSQKYPGESCLAEFLNSNGGGFNAFTERDQTVYYSQTNFSPNVLQESLDRYADMLTRPLFDVDFMEREVQSIENELHLRRTGSFFRLSQLINEQTICEDKHPLKMFMCGSRETLLPKGRTIDQLKAAVINFQKIHYIPENMALVVQAPMGLDDLQKMVEHTFGKLKGEKRPKPTETCKKGNLNNTPYSLKEFNRLYTIKPGNHDVHNLNLAWAFSPEAWKSYKSKPLEYIASALVEPQEDGLVQYLQSQNWILGFDAGVIPSGSMRNDYATLFTVNLHLSQEGRDMIVTVVETIFGYIKTLQKESFNLQKHRYEKLQSIADVKFQSLPMGHGENTAIDLVQCMFKPFDKEDLITGNTLYQRFEPALIKKYLNQMTPENACFMLITADAGENKYLTEPWYDAKYLVQDLSRNMRERFKNPNAKFLTCKGQSIEREKLLNTQGRINQCQIFYGDVGLTVCPTPMATPQTLAAVTISSPMLDPMVIRSNVHLFDVWAKMVEYDAQTTMAYNEPDEVGTRGSSYFIRSMGSLRFKSVGLKLLTGGMQKAFLQSFHNLNCATDYEKELFQIAKEANLHRYYGAVTANYVYAIDLTAKLRCKDHLTCVECYCLLSASTPDNLSGIMKKFRQDSFCCGAIQGTAELDDGTDLISLIRSFNPKAPTEKPKTTEANSDANNNSGNPEPKISNLKLFPNGERCFRIKALMPKEKPFAVLNCYQMDEPTCESAGITVMATNLLRETVSEELRNKEQLGYLVAAYSFADIRNTIAILVLANSERHSICHVDQRMENCIQTFYDTKLTREILVPRMKAYGIRRDPAFIKEYIRKYLFKDATTDKQGGYRKLSVQVSHEEMHNLCKPEKNCCAKSKWMSPLFHVGKENSEVTIAGAESKPSRNKDVYYIESIEAFHKMP